MDSEGGCVSSIFGTTFACVLTSRTRPIRYVAARGPAASLFFPTVYFIHASLSGPRFGCTRRDRSRGWNDASRIGRTSGAVLRPLPRALRSPRAIPPVRDENLDGGGRPAAQRRLDPRTDARRHAVGRHARRPGPLRRALDHGLHGPGDGRAGGKSGRGAPRGRRRHPLDWDANRRLRLSGRNLSPGRRGDRSRREL